MTTYNHISESRFYEMRDILPPAADTGASFLVGEAVSERVCRVTGRSLTTYQAFFRFRPDEFERAVYGWGTAFYEASEPLTIHEFRQLRVTNAGVAPFIAAARELPN